MPTERSGKGNSMPEKVQVLRPFRDYNQILSFYTFLNTPVSNFITCKQDKVVSEITSN